MLSLFLLSLVSASVDPETGLPLVTTENNTPGKTDANKVLGFRAGAATPTSFSSTPALAGKTLEDHLRNISAADLQVALEKAGEHGKAGKAYALAHQAAIAEIGAEAEKDAEASFKPKIDALIKLARETDDALKALYTDLSKHGVSHADLQVIFGKGNPVLKKIAESLKPAVSASTVKQDEYRDFDTTNAARLNAWNELAPAVQNKMKELAVAGADESLWFASKGAGKELLAKGKADDSSVRAVDAIAAYKSKVKFDQDKEAARLEAEQEAGISTTPPVTYPSGGVALDLVR